MTFPPGRRSNLGYVGAHASLLTGFVGLLLLQRYLWLLEIARQGYGPYQTLSYLAGASAVVVLVDLVVLKRSWHSPSSGKAVSLLWPAFFFGIALLVIVSNNL